MTDNKFDFDVRLPGILYCKRCCKMETSPSMMGENLDRFRIHFIPDTKIKCLPKSGYREAFAFTNLNMGLYVMDSSL
jgi:hypothetical protein